MPLRVLAACMLLALTAGCGASAGSDADHVRTVVSSYVRASALGNGEQACAFYTPRLRAEIERKARDTGLAGCAELLGTALRYRLSLLPADVRAEVTEAITEPGRVDVELGEDGRAEAALALPDRPTLDTRVVLVRQSAGWRIERLGVRDGNG
jgi:hypothetical protein